MGFRRWGQPWLLSLVGVPSPPLVWSQAREWCEQAMQAPCGDQEALVEVPSTSAPQVVPANWVQRPLLEELLALLVVELA